MKFDFRSSFNLLKDKIVGKRSRLGIYLGRDRITAVESSGSHILKTASLALPKLITQDLGPWTEAIKGFIKENGWTAKEAVIGLSARDLFIRGFQMPLLAGREIDSGIGFEVRKYLPFRTEDLVSDYQYRLNKPLDKTDIFYIAASRNNFDKYLSLFKDTGIRIKAIESAGLGLFRLLLISRQFELGRAIMIITVPEDLDAEFSLMNAGFPCLSREIKLSQYQAPAESGERLSLERLSSEIRVFLDYSKRQFSVNSLDKIVFVAKNANLEFIAGLNKGLGLNIQTLEQGGNPELAALADLDGLKAYALSLRGSVRLSLSVNLLRNIRRLSLSQSAALPAAEAPKAVFRIQELNWGLFRRPLIFALALIAFAYGFPLLEQMDTANNLKQAGLAAEESLGQRFKGLDLNGLRREKEALKKRLARVKDLPVSRIYLTPYFNLLPKITGDGLWIEALELLFKDGKKALNIRGVSCLGDNDKESKAVRDLLAALKDSPDLAGVWNTLEISSTRKDLRGARKATAFEIAGS